MTFEEFQHLARLHAIHALEPEELREFQTARSFFGEQGENYLAECQKLNEELLLRHNPMPPNPATREKILRMATRHLTSH